MSTTKQHIRSTGNNPNAQAGLGSTAEIAKVVDDIVSISRHLAAGMFELLCRIGKADELGAWAMSGALSCAPWLAELCEVELSTARNRTRVARAMRQFPQLMEMMADCKISYAQARILAAHLTEQNVADLLELATVTPLRGLRMAIAAWLNRHEDPDTTEERQKEARCVSWRTDADGMVTITARLQPVQAGAVCAVIDQHVMRDNAPAGTTLGQQRADALHASVAGGGGNVDTEIVIHVREDGNTLTDGTPLSDHSVAKLVPDSFVSLLIHDSERQPIDASPRRRVPTRRQRRVIDERGDTCEAPGCHATTFLQYDHIEPYSHGGPTVLDNLRRLCGPHNRERNH